MLADELRNGRGSRFVAPQVVLDNDANLAAYAESIYGFEDAETLIGIKVSTGIGAGVVVDGRIFRGARGEAGEIGHMVVNPGGRFCSCGLKLSNLWSGPARQRSASPRCGQQPTRG
jgi:glucokinase